MRLLFILILTVVSTLSYSQSICDEDFKALGLSTNFKGVSIEWTHVPISTKVGFMLGSTVYMSKEEGYDWVDNKKVSNGDYFMSIKGAIHMYLSYKLLSEDYSYSLNVISGGVFDADKGIYPSGGLELRKPLNNSCLFIRGLYPLDFRAGILLRL